MNLLKKKQIATEKPSDMDTTMKMCASNEVCSKLMFLFSSSKECKSVDRPNNIQYIKFPFTDECNVRS